MSDELAFLITVHSRTKNFHVGKNHKTYPSERQRKMWRVLRPSRFDNPF